MGIITVATDGFVAADGAAAWAFVARSPDGREARESGALAAGPSHVAEWTAVRRALAWAEATLHSGDALELRTDSALVAKGLAARRPEMSGEAAELRADCRRALARLAQAGVKTTVTRVPREQNAEADQAARRAAHGGVKGS